MSDREPIRVPINQAAAKGISWLNGLAEEHQVILTRFGNPAAVLDSAEHVDESARQIAAARRLVVDSFATAASERTSHMSIEDVCAKLGIDVERVLERSAELAAR